MARLQIDIVDEMVLMKRENDRLKKRLDRIDVLFNQAENLIEILKLELTDIRRSVEATEREMRNGRIVQ